MLRKLYVVTIVAVSDERMNGFCISISEIRDPRIRGIRGPNSKTSSETSDINRHLLHELAAKYFLPSFGDHPNHKTPARYLLLR